MGGVCVQRKDLSVGGETHARDHFSILIRVANATREEERPNLQAIKGWDFPFVLSTMMIDSQL